MASQHDESKQEGGWLPSSSMSLNARTGWSAAAPSAQATTGGSGPEHAHGPEPQPRYLTTSGLFERPPGPPAWKEVILTSTPLEEQSELVKEFRSALHSPENEELIPIRKIPKEVLALVVVGVLLGATALAIYLYRPKEAVAPFQTAKTWMAKQWNSDLQAIAKVFQPQKTGRRSIGSNRRRGLSASLREGQSPNSDLLAAPPRELESQPNEKVAPLLLYVTDSYGRNWILTPKGEALGPVNHIGDPPARKPEILPTGIKDCRSLFYPGCP